MRRNAHPLHCPSLWIACSDHQSIRPKWLQLMFRLLQPPNSSTPPDASSIMVFGKRWVIFEYANPTDAPPYTCISYAWGDTKVRHFLNDGQPMSARTVPSLEAAVASTNSHENWARNVQFSYDGEATREEAEQTAALNASRALWIDALCVPTYEPARSSCLREMGWIFSAAFQVIVVLERQCSGVLRCIGRSEKVDDFALLALEGEKWVRRAWTYQEAVNSRALYFVAEGEENLIVSGQDFLRSITDAIEDYKLRNAFSDFNWILNHSGLSDIELLLADYRIADFADRSAYQVMSVIGQRFTERPDDYFYSMIGSITTTSSQTEESECPHPAEYFMRVCEQKRDFSFIYNTAQRSSEVGQGWRPLTEQFSAVLPRLLIFGKGEPGVRESTHLELEKMFVPVTGAISADALKAASFFMGLQSQGLPAEAIAIGVLEKMRVLGFTGCGEYLEFETGFFFPQLKPQISADLFVAVSCGVDWVRGGPGLLLRSSSTDFHDFVDVGAFVGRTPKSGQSIKIR